MERLWIFEDSPTDSRALPVKPSRALGPLWGRLCFNSPFPTVARTNRPSLSLAPLLPICPLVPVFRRRPAEHLPSAIGWFSPETRLFNCHLPANGRGLAASASRPSSNAVAA